MNTPPRRPEPRPPTLSMDDYADWVCETVAALGPERVARQKALEERVLAPFRMADDGVADGARLRAGGDRDPVSAGLRSGAARAPGATIR